MDRNAQGTGRHKAFFLSLSARRAWIEILFGGHHGAAVKVALRKESVDRNYRVGDIPLHIVRSLSARRAWIEIRALQNTHMAVSSRSPQGERG